MSWRYLLYLGLILVGSVLCDSQVAVLLVCDVHSPSSLDRGMHGECGDVNEQIVSQQGGRGQDTSAHGHVCNNEKTRFLTWSVALVCVRPIEFPYLDGIVKPLQEAHKHSLLDLRAVE